MHPPPSTPPPGGPPPGFDPGPPAGTDLGPPPEGDPGPPGGGPPGPPGGGPPDQGPPSTWDSVRLLFFFTRYLRPVRFQVVLILVCTLLTTVITLPMSFLPQVLTENFGKSDRPFLYAYIAFTFGAIVVSWFLTTYETYLTTVVGESLVRFLRRDVFGNLERLTMLGVYAKGPGEFVQQAGRDVFVVRELFTAHLLTLTREFGQAGAALIAMFVLEPVLTFLFLGAFALLTFPIRYLNRRVEQLANRGRDLNEEAMNQLVENVGGFRDVVAAGRFQTVAGRFDKLLEEGQHVNVSTAIWAQLTGLAPSMLVSIAILVIYLIGLARYEDVKDAGRILTYTILLGQLFPAILAVIRTTTDLAMSAPSMRALRDILSLQPPSTLNTVPLTEPIRSLRFDQVCLDIEGRRIIDNMSFEIPAGKLTAIIGQSGSGKTTVFHLLLRLLEPTAGTILVNGQPVDHFTLESLRSQIGFIPQNPFIFNQTLRENMLLATPEDVPPERMNQAVDTAQMREMVARRAPEGGLEAVAGYMGNRLSGGEKQRLALARLLLRDPQVVVCDEYTANVDVRTARLIHEAMRTLFAGRTRVVITHELYTARGAEWIIVIDQGRVVQQGTPEQLAGQPGLYRELLEVQRLQ